MYRQQGLGNRSTEIKDMMAQQTILTGCMMVRTHRHILFVALLVMFQIRMRMYDDPTVRENVRMCKNSLVDIG